MTFYDNNGKPVFYTDDNQHLFSFGGNALGYIYNGSIYNYNGYHLGWFENGWIIDQNGYYTFYNEYASGGPMKPMKSMRPMKSLKEMKPMKSLREMRPMKPMKSLTWSSLNTKAFFKVNH